MAKNDNWSTPPLLAKVLHTEFKFNLEVCAAKDNRAISTIPYMGLDNGFDALKVDWGKPGDVCYCNPPYSQLDAFIRMGATMYLEDRDVVMLVPAYTDTLAWWDVASMYAEIRFLKGRLRFWENGKPGKDTARFPSALLIMQAKYGHHKGSKMITWWDWKVNHG